MSQGTDAIETTDGPKNKNGGKGKGCVAISCSLNITVVMTWLSDRDCYVMGKK